MKETRIRRLRKIVLKTDSELKKNDIIVVAGKEFNFLEIKPSKRCINVLSIDNGKHYDIKIRNKNIKRKVVGKLVKNKK